MILLEDATKLQSEAGGCLLLEDETASSGLNVFGYLHWDPASTVLSDVTFWPVSTPKRWT